MNITLINPRLKTWNPNIYVPLGLTYIAAALEHEGYSVKIIDMNTKGFTDNKLAKELEAVDIIGITGMITEYTEVLRLVQLSKACNHSAKVILGGALATTWTEKVMSSSEADFAVLGEGELVITNLLSAMGSGKEFSSIKGIAYKDNGRVIINPREDIITNPDSIPFPARHLLDISNYTTRWFKSYGEDVSNVKSCTIFSSRGCPYSCSFCYMDMWGHKWRGRSPDNIISEIKMLQRDYGFNGFLFYDDTFVLDRARILEFCRKVKEENLDIVWMSSGRINLMTDELIKAMKEAGCRGISYGIESGNQGIVNSISKGITLEQVERVTRATEEAGIKVTGLFMLGILGDSKATIQQTIDFARKLNLSFYCFSLTIPLQGTQLYDTAVERGFIPLDRLKDWSYNVNANLTEDCTKKDLEQFSKMAFREFVLAKVYGRYYLLNPHMWLDGLKSLWFLSGKRSIKALVKRILNIIIGR